MTESFESPAEIFESIKKRLDEARAAFEQVERGEAKGDTTSAYSVLKEQFDKTLEEYRQAILDYTPFRPEDRIPTPPLSRAAYSDRMAWVLANMANMAYIRFDWANKANRDAEIARLHFCLLSGEYHSRESESAQSDSGLSFELVDYFDTSEDLSLGRKKTDTQAFLAKTKSGSFAVLVFRGTQPDIKADIWTDVALTLHKTRDGEVHTGFRDAYREVQTQIHESLIKIGKIPLYITGHSLGGALATVAAQDLEHKYGDQIAACYTFGSPRVGDGKYEDRIKVPFYRIVNATDAVTLFPWFLGDYVHVGDPRYLSRIDMKKMLYRGIPVLVRTRDAILEMMDAARQFHNPLGVWASAHSMTFYIEKLQKIAITRKKI